jgi:PAS domain S-box-containing protein
VTVDPGRSVEKRLRAAVESSPSGLLMVDHNGHIVLVNQEVERLFGYSREELLGKSVDMLVPERFRGNHPGYRGGFFAHPRVRAMGAGRDLYGLRKDGTEVPVEIGLTPVATDEGLFVLSSIVDISARKRAELRFRAAVESSPNGMVMVDTSGKIVLVNREVERMFGYDRAELLGQSIEMLVPERFRGNHPMFRTGFFGNPQTRAMGAGRDLFGLRKDGSELPVEIGLNPIETEEGIFVLSSIVDISARKQAEEQRQQLEEQLRQGHKMQAVGTLAGGIAHDFNNILGAIVGFAEFLRDEVHGEQPQTDLRELLKAAERGKELVERILSFSRRQDRELRPLDLGQAAAEAVRLLRATLPAAVEIKLDVHPETPRVLADATSVHQVLMNLGTNAAHAMPTGGRLELFIQPFYVRDSMARARPDLREGPYALLTARDNGVGMDRAVRERVFEPFFTTKPVGAGTGLGLAVVHGIMRDHGGAVELESEPGQGTSVRCLFPALSTESTADTTVLPGTPRGRGERILLVEDEETLAEVGKRRLLGFGYRVTVAMESLEALEIFRARPGDFDLVVTDYSMPRLPGIDLAKAMLQLRPDVPILMITGYMEELSPTMVEGAGIRRLLKKPVTAHDLGSAVHEVLAETRSPSEVSRF